MKLSSVYIQHYLPYFEVGSGGNSVQIEINIPLYHIGNQMQSQATSDREADSDLS